MEEGWCQVLHPDNFLQVMHDQFTQLLLLCPPMGFSTWDTLLLLVQWWHHSTSCQGPTSSGWVIQSGMFPPRHHFVHALCIQARLLWPSFLIQLLKGKQLQFTEQLHTEHFVHHGSHVPGKWVRGTPCILLCSHLSLASLDTRICSTNFIVLFQMAGWTFKDALAAIQSPHSIPILVLLSAGWPLFGGHMLCQDSNYPAYADHTHHSSREMGSRWELQSGVHGWRWLQLFHHHFDPFKS